MNRRSQMEVYMAVLKAVADGRQKPTHIMYRANLCWERLKKLLDFLVKEDLLQKANIDGSISFSLTPRGKDVLGYFRKLELELYYKRKNLPSQVYVHYR